MRSLIYLCCICVCTYTVHVHFNVCIFVCIHFVCLQKCSFIQSLYSDMFAGDDTFMKCFKMRIIVLSELVVCGFQIQVTLPAETLALHSLEIKTTVKATRCEYLASKNIEFTQQNCFMLLCCTYMEALKIK